MRFNFLLAFLLLVLLGMFIFQVKCGINSTVCVKTIFILYLKQQQSRELAKERKNTQKDQHVKQQEDNIPLSQLLVRIFKHVN